MKVYPDFLDLAGLVTAAGSLFNLRRVVEAKLGLVPRK